MRDGYLMPRLQPLSPDTTPELKSHFDFFLGTLGFTPNSVLTMQRRPRLVQAFAQLNAAVMDPAGEVDLGLRRLIDLRPDHAHAYNALGYTFADRNIRLDEARTLIEKALTLLPEDPHILDSMGWVLFRQKDYPRALEVLRKAYAMRPEVEIAAHLGEVLWASGQADEARKLWREARTREPENTTLRETLARLNVAL
jgi:Flp pilus assembly protein TadD